MNSDQYKPNASNTHNTGSQQPTEPTGQSSRLTQVDRPSVADNGFASTPSGTPAASLSGTPPTGSYGQTTSRPQATFPASSGLPTHGNPSNASSVPEQTMQWRTTESGGAPQPESAPTRSAAATQDSGNKLANELQAFNKVSEELRAKLIPAPSFQERCQQAFDLANDLFGNAPTWVCFYRSLMGGSGMIHTLFSTTDEFGDFLRTDQYYQIQLMLTALRSRDLPENDPNDPQRMITVRLPKSLHEAICDEAERLNISVNRLCITRMLMLLDPKMIPKTNTKPRGRKPRPRSKQRTPQTETTA